MRLFLALLIVSLVTACSWNQSASKNAEDTITKTGLIVAKQAISIDEIDENDSRVSTSIYGSIFSGGRISIGLGFLFSPSGKMRVEKPIRYEVKTLEGDQLIVYSESADFDVDDCVRAMVQTEAKKHPPEMKRENRAACAAIVN